MSTQKEAESNWPLPLSMMGIAGPDAERDYAAFVESIVPFCHCADKFKPCDGVLAGGMCDRQGNLWEDGPDDDYADRG